MDRKLFNKKDILIIFILIFLSLASYLYADNFIFEKSKEAEILYNNKVIMTVKLDRDYTFSPDGFPDVVFKVEKGAIAFVESDCPDKICVHTGFINKTGQSAVCLPNKLVLKLKSDKKDVDALL
ncbi:MAG: NusG domain II-containing protein [Lachnospirales bacterium]